MSTIYHAHQRTSPPHVKKTAVRAQRPVPVSRAFSGSKLASKAVKGKAGDDELAEKDDDDDDMAMSFLQYCAFCEKQIVVPNNSILYCSESCRRKDGSKALSENLLANLYTGQLSPEPSFDDLLGVKPRELLLRRPTVGRAATTARIPPVFHDGKSDLDPTEWKPKEELSTESEAFQYLSQFHRSTSNLTSSCRPILETCSSTPAMIPGSAPSLSHTPATSTSASINSLASTPYEFVTRPLPPRHDSTYSASAAAKGVELVVPVMTACNSVPASSPKPKHKKKAGSESALLGDLSYEKKWVVGNPSLGGSLKKLLYLQEMGTNTGN
ncbi:hypothetical protein MMC20_002107 [Loxospora ochrophaea]|nr:hypothetical protein [Loxospora ochrophaea]